MYLAIPMWCSRELDKELKLNDLYREYRARGLSRLRAIRELYMKWVRGEIDLVMGDDLVYKLFYIVSLMIVLVLISFTIDHPLLATLRYFIGMIVVLFIPGYLLINILGINRFFRENIIVLISISIGLSLSINAILYLSLDFIGVRLGALEIVLAISITTYTLLLAFLILSRRR